MTRQVSASSRELEAAAAEAPAQLMSFTKTFVCLAEMCCLFRRGQEVDLELVIDLDVWPSAYLPFESGFCGHYFKSICPKLTLVLC